MNSAKERPTVKSGGEAGRPMLDEIGRLGGEEQMKGAAGALDHFETVLKKLVSENPSAYGAGQDSESQTRVIGELIDSVRAPFLAQTVTSLRLKAGYVKVLGCWVHRAVFTFVGFGLLAALTLPLCAVSLLSTRAWGWVPGAVGIASLLGLGVWILSRVRK